MVVVVDVDVDLLIDAKNSLPSLEKEDISPYRVIFIANGVNLFIRQQEYVRDNIIANHLLFFCNSQLKFAFLIH